MSRDGAAWSFSVPVDLGEIAPEEVAVQLYAEPNEHAAAFLGELSRASSNSNILHRVRTGRPPAGSIYGADYPPPCRGGASGGASAHPVAEMNGPG